jgi:ubiquinone/menaquinone biosynthesis C-methylase UbiE
MLPRPLFTPILLLSVACSKPPPAPPHHPHAGHSPHDPAHSHGQGHGHGNGHDHRDGAPHRFENADEWAKRFESPERDAWQKPDAVVAWVGLGASQSLADIGAGTGYFSVRFARQAPRGSILGVDIEPDMVRYMNERARRDGIANLTAILGATDAPRLPAPVDVVFVCDTYHHIEQRTAYFQKVAASLKPAGRLIIVDFKAADTPVGPPLAMRVAPSQIDTELAPAGFRRVRTDEQTLPHQYMLAYERSATGRP